MTSAYLARQLERWTRPDAHLFVRPDWRRFVPRDADVHPFALYERKYRPDQPRVPAGNSDGGQWTADGGGGGSRSPGSQPTTKPAPINDPRVISDATPDNDWKPGAQYAQGPKDLPGRSSAYGVGRGHHHVARAVANKYPFSEEARRVFNESSTGKLYDPRSNKWDMYHVEYNKAVGEVVDDYLKKNNVRPEAMTEAQARDLHKQVLESGDERIRTYNKRMMMREIRIHILRRFGRE